MVHDFHPNKPKWIPGQIIKKTGPLFYVVRVIPGLKWRRHVDHIQETSPQVVPKPNPTEATMTSEDQYVDTTPHSDNDVIEITPPDDSAITNNAARRYPNRDRRQPDKYM